VVRKQEYLPAVPMRGRSEVSLHLAQLLAFPQVETQPAAPLFAQVAHPPGA